MVTPPVADARANLSKLIDEASTTHERFEITRNGRRVAVLIGADDYDAMCETIAVLSDPALLRSHEEGQQALSDGDVLDAEQIADAMNEVGRPVNTRLRTGIDCVLLAQLPMLLPTRYRRRLLMPPMNSSMDLCSTIPAASAIH